VIRAETEGLANQPRDIEFLKTHRDLLLKHIDRISGIVQRMLQLAKEKPKEEKEIDLNEVLESTLAFFPASLAVFVKDLHPLPKIKADIEELQEVFVNLVQNAIEAMPGGGRITIKTYLDDQKKIVEITDNGKGIPEELREKIFDPFFSTRHEGTGLGLSIVYRIIRQYGGNISVSSEMGKGSTFKIVF
jgi:signal transduction histidine kinase